MSYPTQGSDIPAIFVHAGAGFHSHHNERVHLEACDNASKVAMAVLRAGGSAVDAVEMAIMTLENHEITNSGYGSNLTIDGLVECDATIIDHLGRSGAVGAVEQVKNPISLASVILRDSTVELSLNRVPPNFLVGKGATDYAYESGIVTLHNNGLVSPAARERWERWSVDLQKADRIGKRFQTDDNAEFVRRPIRVHPAQLMATPSSICSKSQGNSSLLPNLADHQRPASGNRSHIRPDSQEPHTGSSPCSNGGNSDPGRFKDFQCTDKAIFGEQFSNARRSKDDIVFNSPLRETSSGVPSPRGFPSTSPIGTASERKPVCSKELAESDSLRDNVTDTVGAIAVDSYGNIAAGSSSGGIGMKHRGRVGPAALVGIGTAVIPVDPNDTDGTSVAAVTSGTGEHIATTMAAQTCASRVYSSQRKGKNGVYEDVTEEEAMNAMIATEFMDHPGVTNSHCQGAIGIMTVKKTNYGVFLYFGHNTDSFALASMTSQDSKPVCVMSRSSGLGSIAQGGRACRRKRYRVRRVPGPANRQP